jgi:hypothetical protein
MAAASEPQSLDGQHQRQLMQHSQISDVIPRLRSNPHVHFLISEAWAGVAGVGVYLIFRCAAWLTDLVASMFPLKDAAPADFLSLVLHWGAAIGGSTTVVLITVYQLLVLFKRLWAEVAA